MGCRGLKGIIIASFLILTIAPAVWAQPAYTPIELFFTVYSNGVAAVDYSAEVDPTLVRVDIPLFGSLYQELLVLDQDGLPLNYTMRGNGINVLTLGSTMAVVYYETPGLTSKSGSLWTFNVTTPIASGIILPEGSTIIDLSDIPLHIGSLDGHPYITMPDGQCWVTYVLGVVGTRESALAQIKDAESTMNRIRSGGVVLKGAEPLLQQAKNAFDAGSYAQAEELAAQAKASALETEAAAQRSSEMIDAASSAISDARAESRTAGLDEAENLLQQAQGSHSAGDYIDALGLATQANDAALAAKAPRNPYLLPAGVVIGVVAIAGVFLYFRDRIKVGLREGVKAEDLTMEEVDLDLVFERHPELRMDDREVIRFLSEAGGEVFANEIRDRFDIPRTSAWRMIRRLERLGIVDERKVGGQSLVRISKRYRRGDEE